MSKFNTATVRSRGMSPLRTEVTASGTTYEGHPGYARDVKSELFLLAVSNFVGEQTFYENAEARDNRFKQLIERATIADHEWTAKFLYWLRSEGNMRSASLVGAAEYARVCIAQKIEGSRQVVSSVLQRADEPGEMLAYWTSTYGRAIPKPIKRGVADAALRLYTERSLLKYDSEGKGWRFADVIDMARPATDKDWQSDLFRHALDRRHNRDNPIPESLTVLHKRAELMATPKEQRRGMLNPAVLAEAGMTWESVAGWLQGPMDAQAWESIIPSMGIMALIRNLRNFDEAGVSTDVAKAVCAKISDPETVAKSRQLPYRWLSAYLEVHNDRWKVALGDALDQAVRNIPQLDGRTLILIDTSGSMSQVGYSAKSKVLPVIAAALFGVALGARCGVDNVDVYGYASGVFKHDLYKGASVLNEVNRFIQRIGEVGHGTDTAGAVHTAYRGHDRVVILTDEQAFDNWVHGNVSDQAPSHIPMYAFNLGGYEKSMLPDKGNRHQLGGLTDHTFKLIPLIESGAAGKWPWEG